MKLSGYDNADPDPNSWLAMRDERFATIVERDFVHKKFQRIPICAARHAIRLLLTKFSSRCLQFTTARS